MATQTLGTNATNSLTALAFAVSAADADVATIQQLIKDDLETNHAIFPGAFSKTGLLYIPNRGVLQMRPGDYVAVDSTTGWPILISARAKASGPYTVV